MREGEDRGGNEGRKEEETNSQKPMPKKGICQTRDFLAKYLHRPSMLRRMARPWTKLGRHDKGEAISGGPES